ncbi:MAG: putative LPS assembly protein LptD [Bacteroidetes bacterium]|nr:putative LPS assembly protein LptD [Bacteroidota bacterium]
MIKLVHKNNEKYSPSIVNIGIFLILTLVFGCCLPGFSQDQKPAKSNNRPISKKPLINQVDSNLSKKAGIIKSLDTNRLKIDTIGNKKDSTKSVQILRVSKDSMDAPVNYNATDSGVMIMSTKEFFLYGDAKTEYRTSQLEAANIVYDQQTQNIRAYGAKDTTGSPLSNPKFLEGDIVSVNDSIYFNMKSGKGLTKNTNFQQGEIFVNANTMKKVSKDVAFAYKARFTTCNLDEPHFAFRTNKMKIITNKIGVSGPTFPEFEGVPFPIGIPFGIFPLAQGRHSGLMAPAFSTSEDFGLGFEGLGYYKVLSDNFDATVRTNIYSYGGWNLNLNSKYIMRYKYMGNFNLSLQNTRMLNRNTSVNQEYTGGRTFMINWTHSMDQRARPGTSFSANVNFGSTKYNRMLLNNPFQNYQNQISSSISYTKNWDNKYNLSVNLNHNQNNNLGLVNMSLPNINFNAITIYPFQSKDQIGAGKWYEKLGIGYNGSFQNQLSFYDSALNFRRLLDTMQWGAQHSIPISLSLPSLGPITVTPGISFEEKWFGQQNIKTWNNKTKQVDTSISRGFYRAPNMSFSLGTASRIFGTYKFKKNSTVQAIRHEVRPSLSMNYTPDLAASYHYTTQIDSTGRNYRFSKYDGGMGGGYSEGTFGGMGFGVDNLLEMKMKDKKDTTEGAFKKVKLIEGFGFNSSYNFLADSFALGNFNIYMRTTLFDKLNITSNLTMDPYKTDKQGFRVNKLDFDPTKLKFGNITSGGLSFSTSFKSKSTDGKESKQKDIPIDPFMTPDEQQRQLQYAKSNPAEFTDFNIPWSLTLSYSFQFSRYMKPDYSGFQINTYSSLNFNGDFSITPKWKLGGTGYIDVAKRSVQQLSMFITREMHCWQLAINVTPIGLYKSFSITVNPKSGILRDLKINRSRTFSSSSY